MSVEETFDIDVADNDICELDSMDKSGSHMLQSPGQKLTLAFSRWLHFKSKLKRFVTDLSLTPLNLLMFRTHRPEVFGGWVQQISSLV